MFLIKMFLLFILAGITPMIFGLAIIIVLIIRNSLYLKLMLLALLIVVDSHQNYLSCKVQKRICVLFVFYLIDGDFGGVVILQFQLNSILELRCHFPVGNLTSPALSVV